MHLSLHNQYSFELMEKVQQKHLRRLPFKLLRNKTKFKGKIAPSFTLGPLSCN